MKKNIWDALTKLFLTLVAIAFVVAMFRASKDEGVVEYSRRKGAEIKTEYEKHAPNLIDCIFNGNCKSSTRDDRTSSKSNDIDKGKTNQSNKENPLDPALETKDTTDNNKDDLKLKIDEIDEKQKNKIDSQIISIKTGDPEDIIYERSEWKHWVSYKTKCWNVREEALLRQAIPNTVQLLDKNKVPTTKKENACYISKGEWYDNYSGSIQKESNKMDLDHIVPLSYAARHGGNSWTPEKKQQFANDLENNLIIVSARENRSKSDKGPSKYMPPNEDFQCIYAQKWVNVVNKYGLTVTEKDKEVIAETIEKKCIVRRR